jgi:hypothetical protein
MSTVWVRESDIEIVAATDSATDRSIAILINGRPCLLTPMPVEQLSLEVAAKFHAAVAQICIDGPVQES